jgi:hypothetical protein
MLGFSKACVSVFVVFVSSSNLLKSITPNEVLLKAARECDSVRVFKALSDGANPNYQDPFFGETALMVASERGYMLLAQELLARGALVNVLDRQGRTALFWPAHATMASLLLSHDGDVNVVCQNDSNPLKTAAARGHLETLALFLEHKAPVVIESFHRIDWWHDEELEPAMQFMKHLVLLASTPMWNEFRELKEQRALLEKLLPNCSLEVQKLFYDLHDHLRPPKLVQLLGRRLAYHRVTLQS